MEQLRSIRLFYALWPDASTRLALQQLQKNLPLTGRLVPAENLHLTLAFLGDQSEDRLPALEKLLQRLPCPTLQLKLSLKLDVLGYFKGSRIAWLGMQTPPEGLRALQTGLTRMLKEEGVVYPAGGKFTPHVSLARKAAPLPQTDFIPVEWQAMQLVLVRSVLLPEGSRYEVVAAR